MEMEESKDTTEPTRVFKKQRLSSTRPDLTLSERLKKFIPSLKLKNETLSVIEDKGKSHAIVIAKKYSLKDIQKDQDYFFKEIDSEDDIFININIANLEVFSQQYYRALYPSHLTGSINPFTKYRVAIEFDQAYEKPLKLYVASKAIDFKKPKNLIYQYSLLRQKGLHAPGIASVSFLAKFIGEIDFKVGNVGLRAYSTDQSSFSHIFTQIDSGCAFAGIPSNPGYSQKEFFAGYINSEELTSHPSTKMNVVNYLQSINAKKCFDPLHQYLLALSEQPDIIKETMVTALRCAMTPRCFNEWMIATHFGPNEDATLLKLDPTVFLGSMTSLSLIMQLFSHM
jgi:hypothetical protein